MHIMYWIHLLSKPSMYTKSFYVFRQNSNQDDISIKMTDSSPEHNPWHCLLFRCCLSPYNSWRWGELFFKFFKNSRELWILKNCSFTFLLIAMCCFTYNSVFALSGPATISNQNISRSSLAVPSPSLWSLCSLTSSLSPSLLSTSLSGPATILNQNIADQALLWVKTNLHQKYPRSKTDNFHFFSTFFQVAAAMGVMCILTGLIYLADFFFCLTQRRKFLDDRGYWIFSFYVSVLILISPSKGWNKHFW